MKFRDIKWLAVIGAVAAVLAYPAQGECQKFCV